MRPLIPLASKILPTLTALIGVLVIIGWYSHTPWMIQVHPSFVPMQFNTALGLAVLGTAQVLRLPLYVRNSGIGLICLVGLLTLVQYIWHIDLGFDQLLMEHYITVETSHPGRMAPNTALCFMLMSFALLLKSLSFQHDRLTIFSTLFATLTVAFSAIAFFGYVSGLVLAYGWGELTQMAVHTSAGFLFLGIGLLLSNFLAIKSARLLNSFFMVSLIPLIVTFTFCLHIALQDERNKGLQRFINSNTALIAHELEEKASAISTAFKRMGERWQEMNGTPESLWREDARAYLHDIPSINAIEWVDSNKVVRWIEPLEGNEKALNLDIGKDPLRNHALKEARNFSAYYSPKVALVQGYDALFLLTPLKLNNRDDGWLLALIDISTFFEEFSKRMSYEGLNVKLIQSDGQVFYEANSKLHEPISFNSTKPVNVTGRSWTLVLTANELLLSQHQSQMNTVVSILTLALLLCATFLFRQYRMVSAKEKTVAKLFAQKQSILNTIQDAIVVTTSDGTIKEVNRGFDNMFGYPHKSMIGCSIFSVISEPKVALREIVQTNDASMNISEPIESTGIRSNGTVFPVDISIAKGNNSNESFLTVVVHNLSEQVKARRLLAQKESILNIAVHNSMAGFALVNTQGGFEDVNEAFARWLEYERHELIGQPVMITAPEDEKEFTRQTIEKLIAGDIKSTQREKKYLRKDGSTVWGIITASCVRGENGEVINLVAQIVNIQREKELANQLEQYNQALERSNEDLKQFAYVASHDLKAPLNAIEKLVNWLEEDCIDILPDASRQHLKLLTSRTERMRTLLDDLLAYSRVGRIAYAREEFLLSHIVTQLTQLLGCCPNFDVQSNDITLNIQRVPFELVMRNLLSNAIKHHDKEKGVIQIRAVKRKDRYDFQVKDDGPGINPELHDRAIEMFQTLQSRDEVEGSGMGLALVKKTVEHYGGTFSIESDGFTGTTIHFSWSIET